MSGKSMTVSLGISSDTRVEGKYFLDVRDTTNGRNRQMTTRVNDAPEILTVINELMDLAAQHKVEFTTVDLGHEDLNILKFRCGECGHYMVDAVTLWDHSQAH